MQLVHKKSITNLDCALQVGCDVIGDQRKVRLTPQNKLSMFSILSDPQNVEFADKKTSVSSSVFLDHPVKKRLSFACFVSGKQSVRRL